MALVSKAQFLVNVMSAKLPPIKSFKPMCEQDPLGSMTDDAIAHRYNTKFLPEFNKAINQERELVMKTVLEVLEDYFTQIKKGNK